jgi:hypothetical protein
MAQGSFTVLNTGGGQALVTGSGNLNIDGNIGQAQLQFNFGFASQESASAGTIHDSLTISMQSSDGLLTTVFLTIDPNGLLLSPPSTGTLQVNPAQMSLTPTAYPSLQPSLPNQTSYLFSAPLPSAYLGKNVTVYFDLFNNQDSQASQAWFNNLAVVPVPEPPAYVLILTGGLFCCLAKFRYGGARQS